MLISSILLSLSFIKSAICLASSIGGFLLILDKTIATFVEMSPLNFAGGISTLIPDKLSGNSNKLSLWADLITFSIFNK